MPIRIAGMAAPFIVLHTSVRTTLNPCGSGLARDYGGTFNINVSARSLSRASPLPQGYYGVSSSAGRTPGIDQFDKGALHLLNQHFIVDFPGQPRAARFLENGPADGEPATGLALTGLLKAFGQR